MDRKILGSNRARILVKKVNTNNEFVNVLQKNLKRNCDHLATRGPPAKVYLGINHQVVRANTSLNEPYPTLRKRISSYYDTSNNIHGKFPKTDIEDDIEEMRRKMEQITDDYKENVSAPVETHKGPKIWHIEAYIEQNVYDVDDATPTS